MDGDRAVSIDLLGFQRDDSQWRSWDALHKQRALHHSQSPRLYMKEAKSHISGIPAWS